MIWAGHVAWLGGERRSAYSVWVEKPDGKRPHGRDRRRWDDNIKMYLQDVEWGRNGLNGPEKGQVAGTCECSNESSISIECGEFLDYMKICQLLKKDTSIELVNRLVI